MTLQDAPFHLHDARREESAAANDSKEEEVLEA
jgi:hypothetical protein